MSLFNHPGLLEIRVQPSQLTEYKYYEKTYFIMEDDIVSIDVGRSSHVSYISPAQRCEAGTIHRVEINIMNNLGLCHTLCRDYYNEENAKSAYLMAKSDVESLFTSEADHDIVML